MERKNGISPQEIARGLPHVAQLSLYPIKGAGALHPDSLGITTTGLVLHTWKGIQLEEPVEDRGIVLLRAIAPESRKRRTDHSTWQYISQLNTPRLVLVQPDILSDGTVVCNARGMRPLLLTKSQTPQELRGGSVDLFDATLPSNGFNDLGDPVSSWFSEFLQIPCRAVRFRPDISFENKSNYHDYPLLLRGDDDAQILLMNKASVADLNIRLGNNQSVSMDAFRSNIILEGLLAYIEDGLVEVIIGENKIRITILKQCIRCSVTMVDATTGKIRNDGQPLRELSTYRKIDRGVALGVYGTVLSVENQGNIDLTIRVGDNLTVIKTPPTLLRADEDGKK